MVENFENKLTEMIKRQGILLHGFIIVVFLGTIQGTIAVLGGFVK